jgi:hypothetical protein
LEFNAVFVGQAQRVKVPEGKMEHVLFFPEGVRVSVFVLSEISPLK